MERNQLETNKRLDENNKRLDDVMKSNMKLQEMLVSVLGNISGKNPRGDSPVESSPVKRGNDNSESEGRNMSNVDACSVGRDKSELWWDNFCDQSGDEAIAVLQGNEELPSPVKRSLQVSLNLYDVEFIVC